ncbi:SDR family oxidoreductase [Lacisediminihabitans changchengi]|uniref:SDR family oxidoreductase n=1 Tax=Lacisediminihabitans changchengi TaxID=2787634 RepID=A0A934SKT1_9MICO|nr:SDR family oxidoreductase [Lacisediminihabitans changchengi]MBK4347199.1 SDR family oxidoreductase [Lacisediminihabitans changchengi]
MTIAITGATGSIGGALFRQLSDAGADVRPISRADASYADTSGLTAALRGTETVFLVSGRESLHRVLEHESAVEAIANAGAKRVVYLSFYGAAADCTFTFGRDHWHTEQRIRDSGLEFTFLRDNFYQKILPFFADRHGVIRGPAGDGVLSAVADRDVVDVAAAVLQDTGHNGATYDLTGPADLSMRDIAAALSRVSGREVTFVNETVEEAYVSRAHFGAPKFEVDGWVTTYLAIARGETAGVSGDVAALTGHKPQDFDAFLAENPATWAHLLPAAG